MYSPFQATSAPVLPPEGSATDAEIALRELTDEELCLVAGGLPGKSWPAIVTAVSGTANEDALPGGNW